MYCCICHIHFGRINLALMNWATWLAAAAWLRELSQTPLHVHSDLHKQQPPKKNPKSCRINLQLYFTCYQFARDAIRKTKAAKTAWEINLFCSARDGAFLTARNAYRAQRIVVALCWSDAFERYPRWSSFFWDISRTNFECTMNTYIARGVNLILFTCPARDNAKQVR